MRLSSRLLAISLPLLLILSGAALADTCNDFATYNCAKSTPNIVHVGGGISSGQSVGILLNSNTFTVSTSNGKGGADVIILAAFANGSPQGSINGINFVSSVGAFEGGSSGAIISTMQGLGFCGSTCNLSYGHVDLGTALATNGSLTLTASGVPAGTVLYAEVVNSDGQIVYITPNSEAGILGGSTNPVPEPGSLTLMGTGLLGIAAQIRRKLMRG
jgi:PEP-CTERM motif